MAWQRTIPFGYRMRQGKIVCNPEEANVVKDIFDRYLQGKSLQQIATAMTAQGIRYHERTECWNKNMVKRVLENDHYLGDERYPGIISEENYLAAQKRKAANNIYAPCGVSGDIRDKTVCGYCGAKLVRVCKNRKTSRWDCENPDCGHTIIADIFTHQSKKNMGELPKYYVHDCHPAIIDRETFRKAQEEIARRAGKKRTSSKAKTELGKYSGKFAFSELLVCGECGSPYRRQTYMPRGEKYHVWRCLNRLENGKRICKQSPTFKEYDLQTAVLAAVNEMFSQRQAKDAVRDSLAAALASEAPRLSLPAIEAQLQAVQERHKKLLGLAMAANPDDTSYDAELQKICATKAQLMLLKAETERTEQDTEEYDKRMAQLERAVEQDSGAIEEYDEVMVRQLISSIKVLDKKTILVRFKDGSEITQQVEKLKPVSEQVE